MFKPGDLTYFGNHTQAVQQVGFAGFVSSWPKYKFFRRKHVRINGTQPVIEKPVAPLVEFDYPISDQPWQLKQRTVRLIGANGKYLVGLDFTYREGKDHWQFKKFLQTKVQHFRVVEFNPSAVK